MPATDSPAVIVARFLKSNNYDDVSLAVDAVDTKVEQMLTSASLTMHSLKKLVSRRMQAQCPKAT